MNLKSLFGRQPAAPYPPAAEFMLAASKTCHTLSLLAETNNQDIFRGTPGYRDNLIHDLAVKSANRNLKAVTLNLLNDIGEVVCHQTISFTNSASPTMHAGTGGQELPLLLPGVVVKHELTVTNVNSNEDHYRHQLKWNWGPATKRSIVQGMEWSTNGHAHITGGRQAGQIHVSADARVCLIVTRPIGARHFGFATCPELNLDRVFLHRDHFPKDCLARFGQKLTAHLVQCPLGYQARKIEILS